MKGKLLIIACASLIFNFQLSTFNYASAQLPCNDTLVTLSDTLCTGDTLRWAGQVITYGGAYYDTVPRTGSNAGCDSVTIRRVRFIDSAEVVFFYTPVCRGSVGYMLQLGTFGTYLQWSSDPPDSTLQLEDPPLWAFANPQVPTRYTVNADYSPTGKCPGHGSLRLNPVQPVTVRLDLSPHSLDYGHPNLQLHDLSIGNREAPWGGWVGRNWFINGQRLDSQQPDILYTVGIPAPDSVHVLMQTFTPTCIDTAEAVVPFVKDLLFIPNIFTPDGENNRTFLPLLQRPADYRLVIFNRRGQLVFQSSDPQQPWDGTCQGRPCPQGTYNYRLRYSHTHSPAEHQTLTGTVTLLR